MWRLAPMAYRPLHQRALIRMALVRMLKEDATLANYFGERVWGNRQDHWLTEELPAMGLYTLSEDTIESDRSPDPDERTINLALEILDAQTSRTDDRLDAFTLMVENCLELDKLGNFMGEIVNEIRQKYGLEPLEKAHIEGLYRYAIDTNLRLRLTSTELGLAVDGIRQLGVAVMNFDLEYRNPQSTLDLPDFLEGITNWQIYFPEEMEPRTDMQSRVTYDPTTPKP